MYATHLLRLSVCLLLPVSLALPAAAQDAARSARDAAVAANNAAQAAKRASVASRPGAAAVDRLGVPGPIRFQGRDYVLAWSSNPGPTLYKQEYLPAGQTLESFNDMIVIDVRPDTAGAAQTAAAMAETISQRKATDAMANFDLLKSKQGGEFLLDFLLSAPHQKDRIVVEWNAYRYRDIPGAKGSIMVGISRRAYGDADARTFLTGLKQNKSRDIDALAQLSVPVRVP